MNRNDNNDFVDFCQTPHVSSPQKLDELVLEAVKSDLEPSLPFILSKVLLIQAFVGSMTMIFCPQFDLSLTANHDLFHFFHRNLGYYGCMAVCGGLFIGSGVLVSSLLLRMSELDLIFKSKYLLSLCLSGVAVSCFLFLGAEIYLNLALYWMTGACLSSVIILSGVRKLRYLTVRQL